MEKNILLNNPGYIAYMKKVNSIIGKLPKNDQYEIQQEITSHIYESLLRYPGMLVDAALQNLGEPHTYLPEWIVTRKLERATRTFDPVRIIRQLILGIIVHSAHAVKYILFVILYIFLLAFASLSVIKIISPSHTGLLVSHSNITFGYTSNTNGAYEVLGLWFIPICLFITIMLYMVITLLLKMSLFKVRERYL